MIRLELLFGVVNLAMTVYCLIECISTPNAAVRNLPKFGWILLILLFPFVGWIAWLVAGRPVAGSSPRAFEPRAPGYPEYDRPGRASASTPEKDEEFLSKLRERAEEQRRRYEEQRRRAAEGEGPTD